MLERLHIGRRHGVDRIRRRGLYCAHECVTEQYGSKAAIELTEGLSAMEATTECAVTKTSAAVQKTVAAVEHSAAMNSAVRCPAATGRRRWSRRERQHRHEAENHSPRNHWAPPCVEV